MKTILTGSFLFVALLLFSCNLTDPGNENSDTKIPNDEKSAKLVAADNEFGLELFRKIRNESDKENIMISPLSVSVAFAMAYNGADSDTKTEMEKALKLNGLTVDEINNVYKVLINALQSADKDVVFEIANAIYYADGFTAKNNFLDVNRNVYKAEVNKLDFSSQKAVDTINKWVAEKTNDKITKIIENLNPMDRMVLLNAIYFNGIWKNKFKKDGTHLLPFTRTDGSNIDVPMMNKEEQLAYQSNQNFSSVKIPYGTGQYNMVILLPAEGKTSASIIESITSENWNNWMKGFRLENNVVVTMPRFKYAFETGLKNVLAEMGMKNAFDSNNANFSKISDEFLYISSAIHKSFIDVNEDGTEAAAVTSITFTTTSIGNEPPKIYFMVNKPFVYAITESETGAILFIGEVRHPGYD
jgi:serpin B